ncbi:hypothetical protein SODALDRAFT_376076 [Sodiomyces alkalinus F11]|uniref:Uncharacterized protein n=1 Tax=Sodiomyces alkalinus (strain CBS 110278 / VKM F-3762 / F11) TaxID=1314773 RepID=A0A3N2Q0I7_SODAK|nr:hypothetical protein SODALDRAFT_376076 [Sodiomyces alkalinus F11]ROT40284.1 hypothetical protein SODALDRAFT_376076 [Sodiomyces alkalinus F11]
MITKYIDHAGASLPWLIGRGALILGHASPASHLSAAMDALDRFRACRLATMSAGWVKDQEPISWSSQHCLMANAQDNAHQRGPTISWAASGSHFYPGDQKVAVLWDVDCFAGVRSVAGEDIGDQQPQTVTASLHYSTLSARILKVRPKIA